MTTVSIRLDDEEKKELDSMCAEMGMNITTFYMIYTKKVLRDRRIPFEIAAPEPDFYCESNMKQLRRAMKQYQEGKFVVKSMEELEELANE